MIGIKVRNHVALFPFWGKFSFCQIRAKRAQNGLKLTFWTFSQNWVIRFGWRWTKSEHHMMCNHRAPVTCLEKLIWLNLGKKGPKARPIRLQDSLISCISWTTWWCFLILCMELNNHKRKRLMVFDILACDLFGPNWPKKSLANQIAGFFDQLYLLNRLMIFFDFVHGVRQP